MRNTLEKILEYGRTIFDAPPTRIGNTPVQVEIDYKVILMSNYVSHRILDLSGRKLEVSFIYGGQVRREQNKTTLNLNGFYIPPKQKIAEGSFDATTDTTYDANQHFAKQKKRIVAIGHSHASYDVFHSGSDLENYQSLVGHIGIRVNHATSAPIVVPEKYKSISRRLNKIFNVERPACTPASFSYILPSLVFNAKGQNVDSIIAAKSYSLESNKARTHFELHDCHLRVYNKQAVLTDIEKKSLDYSIRKVLSYNGL